MPLHIPDAKVQSLNLSRDKDANKSATGLSNYSMTWQEKQNAENSVAQMLTQKNEVNEWTVGDVVNWLQATSLAKNATNLPDMFL